MALLLSTETLICMFLATTLNISYGRLCSPLSSLRLVSTGMRLQAAHLIVSHLSTWQRRTVVRHVKPCWPATERSSSSADRGAHSRIITGLLGWPYSGSGCRFRWSLYRPVFSSPEQPPSLRICPSTSTTSSVWLQYGQPRPHRYSQSRPSVPSRRPSMDGRKSVRLPTLFPGPRYFIAH